MRYRPKRENYYSGVYGEIRYQENLEKYCTYLENKNKQLTLTEVGCSLPSKEEMNIEIENKFLEWEKPETGLCKESFTLGFKLCYYWIKVKNKK